MRNRKHSKCSAATQVVPLCHVLNDSYQCSMMNRKQSKWLASAAIKTDVQRGQLIDGMFVSFRDVDAIVEDQCGNYQLSLVVSHVTILSHCATHLSSTLDIILSTHMTYPLFSYRSQIGSNFGHELRDTHIEINGPWNNVFAMFEDKFHAFQVATASSSPSRPRIPCHVRSIPMFDDEP